MDAVPCISQIASLLAEPKRTAMLWALMDGSTRSPSELAALAGLSSTSANAHLARLTAGGLLRVRPGVASACSRRRAGCQRRHRRLGQDHHGLCRTQRAGRFAAGPGRPAVVASCKVVQWPSRRGAGRQLYQHLLEAGWIERYEQRTDVTVKGAQHLAGLGIFTQALTSPLVCNCFDWSQAQPHLGGALGAGLLQLFLQSNWISVINESQALQVHDAGRLEIARLALPG